MPADGDTVINYTQRRLLWINDWLIENRNVDPERVAIQGHSVGSAGTTALAKAFPNIFATASVFNNGFGGPTPKDTSSIFGGGATFMGTEEQNLPSNLRNFRGEVVHAFEVFDLSMPIAATRDMPIMRSWHGKNDGNGTMEWDAFVVEEYLRADSDAWGMQLFWDERPHGLLNLNTHWSQGSGNAQTERDDAAYQVRYRANQSFPAFYNHHIYPGSNKDPGDGTRGTGGAGVGDDWGTFGGYHDWQLDTIIDTPDRWEVTAFLIGLSAHAMDNSPDASLVSDLTIRKPQRFLPESNAPLSWLVVSLTTGDTLQSGATLVDADGLVKVDNITVYRDPERIRIIFTSPTATAVDENRDGPPGRFALHQNYPNPFNPSTTISYSLPQAGEVKIRIFDLLGREVRNLVQGHKPAGRYSVLWDGRDDDGRPVSSGTYFYQLNAGPSTGSGQVAQTRQMFVLK